MLKALKVLVAFTALVLVAAACETSDGDGEPQAFTMSDPDMEMVWVVVREMELACDAPETAGGEIAGTATFGSLGELTVSMSAAWDVGNANPDPTQAEYDPDSPDAAGPFAPVLGQAEYPYEFAANPETQACEQTVAATGVASFTADNGDELTAEVVGGETHRLDVAEGQEGDGIESFVEIEFAGGTGQFADASGSAVLHVITHLDPGTAAFVIDEIGVLAGGSIEL